MVQHVDLFGLHRQALDQYGSRFVKALMDF